MTEKKTRATNKNQTEKQPKPAPLQAVSKPVPALVERAEPQVIYYQPQENQDIPKNRFTRWLYHRSQIILGVLTFGVLVLYAIQWLETRNTRELENRAYVAVKSVEIVRQTPDTGTVFVIVVNTGRTPGKDGEIRAKLELLDNSPLDSAEIPAADEPSSKILFAPQIDVARAVGAIGMVAPPTPEAPQPTPTSVQGKTPTPTSISTPVSTPTPPAQTSKKWYVYGVVLYNDTFGNSHRTKFCQFNRVGTSDWWYCPTFNDAN